METTHTPGPWMNETRRGRAIVIDADGNEVCEAYADARLIAAAPDLLDALRHVLDLLSREQAEVFGAQMIARAAIARATISQAQKSQQTSEV